MWPAALSARVFRLKCVRAYRSALFVFFFLAFFLPLLAPWFENSGSGEIGEVQIRAFGWIGFFLSSSQKLTDLWSHLQGAAIGGVCRCSEDLKKFWRNLTRFSWFCVRSLLLLTALNFSLFFFFLGLLIIMAMSVIRVNVESEAVCSHVRQFCSFVKSCARI